MNKKLVFGTLGLVSVGLVLYLSDFRHPTALVIDKDVPRGTKVEVGMVKEVEVLNRYDWMVTDRSQLVGKYLKTEMKNGEYAYKGDISDTPLITYREGEGTYALPVTIDSSVGWKLATGDFVSVVWFDRSDKKSKMVMSNIVVDSLVTTGGRDLAKLSQDEDKNVAVVNVKVTPSQAEQLDQYKNTGALSLVRQNYVEVSK